MAVEDYYTGEIVWHIPENVKDEIECLAQFRYDVKVRRQNPADVCARMMGKILDERSKEIFEDGNRTL